MTVLIDTQVTDLSRTRSSRPADLAMPTAEPMTFAWRQLAQDCTEVHAHRATANGRFAGLGQAYVAIKHSTRSGPPPGSPPA